MKRYFSIIFISILICISSCKKEDTADVSTTVKVSYPAINLNGAAADSVVFVPVGGTFTEPGATLVDDITGAQSQITAESNDVDVNNPGVYYVTYRASNSNGFETVRFRVIAVYDTSIAAEDYSGTYAHLNARLVTVTQLAPRYFFCDDLYGTFNIPIPAYFVDIGTMLYVPQQAIDPSLGNEMHGEGEKTGTPGSYVLDFYGLIRDGFERPRILTQQ